MAPWRASPLKRRLSIGGLFGITLPACAAIAAWGMLRPEALARVASATTSAVFGALDWFVVLGVTGMLVLVVTLALSPYGRLRLGGVDERPEFGLASWLSMLFAAGMGVGLLFWGVAEPLTHLRQAPGSEPGSAQAARQAVVVAVFHWGLHAWAVYAAVALVLAYFGYRRREPYLPGAPLRNALEGWWVRPVAWGADLVAVLAVALGMAGSVGMGVIQLQAGLHALFGVDAESVVVAAAILVAMTVANVAAVATGLDKGIKWLSNANMALAVALLLAVAVLGPTGFILRGFISALGDYMVALPSYSLQLYPYQDVGAWLESWTLTYFIWWIAWAPFVGVFIARISRGRTIRGFVTGVLLVPTVFSVLWFSVFGGAALHEERFGAGGLAELVTRDVGLALFSLFDRLPLAAVLSTVALVLVFVFLVTSVNAATFVLGMLTSDGSLTPTMSRQLVWALTLAALGAALVLSGNIYAVRAISVLGALPFIAVILLQLAALLRLLRRETRPKA